MPDNPIVARTRPPIPDPSPPPAPPSLDEPAFPAVDALRTALAAFVAIAGVTPEQVTGLRRSEAGGWSVLVDVVELSRIPESTSVIGTYRLELDQRSRLCSYERIRRYTRGTVDG